MITAPQVYALALKKKEYILCKKNKYIIIFAYLIAFFLKIKSNRTALSFLPKVLRQTYFLLWPTIPILFILFTLFYIIGTYRNMHCSYAGIYTQQRKRFLNIT